MTLYDLEQQLRFARQMGAEDNDRVLIDKEVTVVKEVFDDNGHWKEDREVESYHESSEPNRALLERQGKREIVIR